MAYGQKNYNEIMGINGKYRIRDIGCFLTAFSNLEQRFNRAVDPITLNSFFRDNNLYLMDPEDGVKEDLGWGSITPFDHSITVRSINGAGWNIDNNSIVKFIYRSFSQPTLTNGRPNMVTHFCLVADATKRLIVDSWDGIVKVSPYGDPVQSATYTHNEPQVVTSPPPANTPTIDNSPIATEEYVVKSGDSLWAIASRSGNDYHVLAQMNELADPTKIRIGQVLKLPAKAAPTPAPAETPAPQPAVSETKDITVQAGWGITHVLQAAGYAKSDYENEAEWDRVAKLNGSDTRLRLKPGQVVKVYSQSLSAAQPAPAAVAPPETPPPPQTAATEPEKSSDGGENVPVTVIPVDFKKSWVEKKEDLQAKAAEVIKDLEEKLPDMTLNKDQVVHSVGTFEKGGVKYHRVQKWVDGNVWYGIEDSHLEPYDDPELFRLDLSLSKEAKQLFHNLSAREKVVALFASIGGIVTRVGVALKIKKVKGA
jgi:LysM repeat protein